MLIQDNDPYTQPSFSLSHRLRRALWMAIWLLLFRPSPRPLHAWRVLLLRAFGARIGRHCHFYPGVRVWAPWNLVVGDFVGVADGANLYCMDVIRLHDFVVVSQGAHLCGGTHDYNSPNFQLVVRPIEVGRLAWICAEAFVHPGVRIAEGAVVGARAVVTRDVTDPWSVNAGHPCRRIGARSRAGEAALARP